MQVYLIQNMINGKCYVGQTIRDLDKYFSENITYALAGSSAKPLLYRAIRKYGKDKFTVHCLRECANKEELDEVEKDFIKLFGTRDPMFGYNCTDGGDGVHGLVHSESSKNKMRASNKGISDKCREAQKSYLANRIFSEEHRNNLSKSRKGIKFSDDQLSNMAAAQLGKKHTAERRMNQSMAQKNRWATIGRRKVREIDSCPTQTQV